MIQFLRYDHTFNTLDFWPIKVKLFRRGDYESWTQIEFVANIDLRIAQKQ